MGQLRCAGPAPASLRYFDYEEPRAEPRAGTKPRKNSKGALAPAVPPCVDAMRAEERATLEAFAALLSRTTAPRTLLRRLLLRAREEVQQELLTWNDRGMRPDVEAWHRAVERQVAAEVAAAERLRAAKRARRRSKAPPPPAPQWRA